MSEKIAIDVDFAACGLPSVTSPAFLEVNNWQSSKEIPLTRRPAVLVLPGGGYAFTSDREAEVIAEQYKAAGFQAFVLRYSVAPARYPQALMQVFASIALMRKNAEAWCIDPHEIYVCGFSAGGHLAACAGTLYGDPSLTRLPGSEDCGKIRPDGLILCYPVLSGGEAAHVGSFENLVGGDKAMREKLSLEKRVTADTPRTFLWHTAADEGVSVENSLLFASALKKNGVPFELHVFPNGGHGLSLANDVVASDKPYRAAAWLNLSVDWIKHGKTL